MARGPGPDFNFFLRESIPRHWLPAVTKSKLKGTTLSHEPTRAFDVEADDAESPEETTVVADFASTVPLSHADQIRTRPARRRKQPLGPHFDLADQLRPAIPARRRNSVLDPVPGPLPPHTPMTNFPGGPRKAPKAMKRSKPLRPRYGHRYSSHLDVDQMKDMIGGAQFDGWLVKKPRVPDRSMSVPLVKRDKHGNAGRFNNLGCFTKFEQAVGPSEEAKMGETMRTLGLRRDVLQHKKGRMKFTGNRGYTKYETPFWPLQRLPSRQKNPHEFPRLSNGIGWCPIRTNIFDRAKIHYQWEVHAKKNKMWQTQDMSLVLPDPDMELRPDWIKIGRGGNRPNLDKIYLQRSALPHIVLEMQAALTVDWPKLKPLVEPWKAFTKSSIRVQFPIGMQSDLGPTTYMNRFIKHHELVHKFSLEKALRRWGVVEGENDERVVNFEMWCPWATHTNVQQYYDVHPDLIHVYDHEQQLALAKYEGEVTPDVVFKQLQKYIAKFHSNIISIFREMDKDCSGTLDVEELDSAFRRLGIELPREKWQMIMDAIDDDKSGELDYQELLDAVTRYSKGGWDAVCRKEKAILNLNPKERAEAVEQVMHCIRQAAYSLDKRGPRKDMDLDLLKVFKEMDVDESGTVDRDEFDDGIRALGADLTDDQLELVFMHFDRDGGGCEYGEFAFTLFNRRQLLKERESWAVTHQQDVNTLMVDTDAVAELHT